MAEDSLKIGIWRCVHCGDLVTGVLNAVVGFCPHCNAMDWRSNGLGWCDKGCLATMDEVAGNRKRRMTMCKSEDLFGIFRQSREWFEKAREAYEELEADLSESNAMRRSLEAERDELKMQLGLAEEANNVRQVVIDSREDELKRKTKALEELRELNDKHVKKSVERAEKWAAEDAVVEERRKAGRLKDARIRHDELQVQLEGNCGFCETESDDECRRCPEMAEWLGLRKELGLPTELDEDKDEERQTREMI